MEHGLCHSDKILLYLKTLIILTIPLKPLNDYKTEMSQPYLELTRWPLGMVRISLMTPYSRYYWTPHKCPLVPSSSTFFSFFPSFPPTSPLPPPNPSAIFTHLLLFPHTCSPTRSFLERAEHFQGIKSFLRKHHDCILCPSFPCGVRRGIVRKEQGDRKPVGLSHNKEVKGHWITSYHAISRHQGVRWPPPAPWKVTVGTRPGRKCFFVKCLWIMFQKMALAVVVINGLLSLQNIHQHSGPSGNAKSTHWLETWNMGQFTIR